MFMKQVIEFQESLCILHVKQNDISFLYWIVIVKVGTIRVFFFKMDYSHIPYVFYLQ